MLLDGLDVVNYSIGSTSPFQPWDDFDSTGFLSARDAGIYVATSAGNAGPFPNTVGSPGDVPWLTAVGAIFHNRKTINGIMDMSDGLMSPPDNIYGVSFTTVYGPADMVYEGDYGDALCLESFPPSTFGGEIVIRDRGQIARVYKGLHVLNGGAGVFILVNSSIEGDSIASDDHFLPAVQIKYENGLLLKAWVADGGANHIGTIIGMVWEENDAWGDIMTDGGETEVAHSERIFIR